MPFQVADVRPDPVFGVPAVERKREDPPRRDPFAVIFPRDMNVRTGRASPVAGGMAEVISRFDDRPDRRDERGQQVQKEEVPAGPFASVAVEVKDDQPGRGSNDGSVRGRYDPEIRRRAAGFRGGGREIERGVRLA